MLFKGKKGLGIAQAFIFIVVALTFAMIMIFGFKAVQDFLDKGEKVLFLQFKNDLENSVKEIYTNYGAVRFKDFRIPGKYEKICFVNMDIKPTEKDLEELFKEDFYASEIWKEAWSRDDVQGIDVVDENVFLSPKLDTIQMKIHKIKIFGEKNEGFLCTKIEKGAFTLVLEGKGDSTELSLPEI